MTAQVVRFEFSLFNGEAMASLDVFKILIVDDNPSIHEDFRKILLSGSCNSELDDLEQGLFGEKSTPTLVAPSYEICSALQGEEAVFKLRESVEQSAPFSMAFVDMRMPPGIDGIETIERMWDEYDQLQVVICTAYSDYSWQETISRLGLTDRLLILKKPFDTIEVCQLALALSVKAKLSNVARLKAEELRQMVAERTCELEEEIERRQLVESQLLERQSELANEVKLDGLTGVQNKKTITDRIFKLASQAQVLQVAFSILFVDIDHFKEVNDTYGHLAGDHVLREVASVIQDTLRSADAVGRFGGEEFVVALFDCPKNKASDVGTRINEAIRDLKIEYEGQIIPVTASVGTATSTATNSDSEELIEFADQALYKAKKNGRNRVEQYT